VRTIFELVRTGCGPYGNNAAQHPSVAARKGFAYAVRMLVTLSARLLSLLQLTRMALVFTAIADSGCGLLLRVRAGGRAGQNVLAGLDPVQVLCIAAISVGLYGFGMSLNDIIDHRRDRQLAAHRPLPSGRVGMVGAHVVCILLAALALGAAV